MKKPNKQVSITQLYSMLPVSAKEMQNREYFCSECGLSINPDGSMPALTRKAHFDLLFHSVLHNRQDLLAVLLKAYKNNLQISDTDLLLGLAAMYGDDKLLELMADDNFFFCSDSKQESMQDLVFMDAFRLQKSQFVTNACLQAALNEAVEPAALETRLKNAAWLLKHRGKIHFSAKRFYTHCLILGDEAFLQVCKDQNLQPNIAEIQSLFENFDHPWVRKVWKYMESLPDEAYAQKLKILLETAAEENFRIKLDEDLAGRLKWNPYAIAAILESGCLACTQTAVLNMLADNHEIHVMAEVLKQKSKPLARITIQKVLEHVQKENNAEATALMLDYQNRHIDPQKTLENQMKREEQQLMETPDTLSYWNRMWNSRPLPDGSRVLVSWKKTVKLPSLLEIPAQIGKYPVRLLEDGLLYNDKGQLKSLIVQEGIEYTGSNSFNCQKLKNLILPKSLKELSFSSFTDTDLNCLILLNPDIRLADLYCLNYPWYFENRLTICVPASSSAARNLSGYISKRISIREYPDDILSKLHQEQMDFVNRNPAIAYFPSLETEED